MSYDGELAEFRQVLDDLEVVGYPKRVVQLAELERLIKLYPDEARALLRRLDKGS